MTVRVAPPASPARAASSEQPASRSTADPRRATRFSSLLGRPEGRPAGSLDGERCPAQSGRPRRAGARGEDDAVAGGLPGEIPGAVLAAAMASVPALGLAGAGAGVAAPAGRSGDDGITPATAAGLVDSLQVGLDRAGQAEVRFDVADGQLKGVEVRLRATPDGIEATFLAEDAAARRSLFEPLAELQRALAERGITVARLEVAVRADVGGDHGSRPRPGAEDPAVAAPAITPAPGPAGGGGAAGLPPWRAGSSTDWIA